MLFLRIQHKQTTAYLQYVSGQSHIAWSLSCLH